MSVKAKLASTVMAFALVGLIVLAEVAAATVKKHRKFPFPLPPQSVYLDPFSFAALGENATFRNDSFTSYFNPTDTMAPFFQIFDPSFVTKVLGNTPSIQCIAYNPQFAFAHEAPIYVADTDEVFFSDVDGTYRGELGYDGSNNNSVVSKISMKEVKDAIDAAGGSPVNVNATITTLRLPHMVQMTNGGTGPYRGNLLLVNSGRGTLPPNLVTVNPSPPYNATVLLDNYFGRQFNSLDDVKVHRASGNIFFTDPPYGYLLQIRPPPEMPSQVYRYNPETGAVKVVADSFKACNGIAFDPSETVAYVSDTGALEVSGGSDQTLPATMLSGIAFGALVW